MVSGRSPGDCVSAGCLGSPASDAEFEAASADGSRVFFTDTQRLTDAASEDSQPGDAATGQGLNLGRPGSGCEHTVGVNGCNLYEYDFAGPAGHGLVAVSAGDTSGRGPQVQGVMAAAGDGSHVYFVAKGVLSTAANSQGQVAQAGADNLYVFERDASFPAGRVSFIATLPPGDEEEWSEPSNQLVSSPSANVTPDGRFLVFTSHGDLTPDDTSSTGVAQVFRYDAVSGELVRVSVGERGFNDNGNAGVGDARIAGPQLEGHVTVPLRLDPSMSHDGAFVFFQSPVGLTPGALDDVPLSGVGGVAQGLAQNVYEWHEGHVYLISDGRDASAESFRSAVQLLGSDASGANVFFSTADRLVPQDTDMALDYYDARICSASDPCITAGVSQGEGCQGEACRGAGAAAPSVLAPGSASFSGAGNLPSPAGKAVAKARKHTRRAHGRKVKHRRRAKRRRAGAHRAARTGNHAKGGRS